VKRAQKVSQNLVPLIRLDVKTSGTRRPSMETILADGFDGMRPSPDDLYDLQAHETGEDYGPLPGHWLRDEFLRWDPEKWQSFIFMSGDFDGGQMSQRKFIRWQVIIETAVTFPAHQWRGRLTLLKIPRHDIAKLYQPLSVLCAFDALTPTGVITADTVLDAIIAAVQLAKITQGDFRRCANPTCKKPPFPVGKRRKRCCSPECTHVVGQRVRRDAAKKAEASKTKSRDASAKKKTKRLTDRVTRLAS
jgi:hypothetical protein